MARRIRFVAGDDKKRPGRALQRCRSIIAISQVTTCKVAGQLVLCRRSRLAASQVMVCSVAGRLFWVGPATLYALQQRFPSPVPSKESDLRRRSGRPATPK